MCRFINADAFTATGQGILGNNMFAYCLNSPINRIDCLGCYSLWYYLIIDHDMGFIHRMVQAHIKATSGNNISTELVLSGLGRADIVDTSVGTVWEVKHASKDPNLRILIATIQATGYIGGIHDDVLITGLGEAGRFSGEFNIICLDETYKVSYLTPQEGVVLYSLQYADGEREYSYAYVPASVREKESKYSFSPIACGFVFGFCGGCYMNASRLSSMIN